MAMRGGLPMIMEKGAGVVDRLMAVYRSAVEDDLMFSVIFRVCFVYRFCSNWILSPNRVWL